MTPNDQTILLALEVAAPMIRNFAAKYGLDTDDLQQEAYFAARHATCIMPTDVRNPDAYLHSAIRYSLLECNQRRRNLDTVSIDAPLHEESNMSLADTLAADTRLDADDLERKDHIRAVVHQALRRLDLDEQRYAREVYGLNGYDPVLPYWPYNPKERARSTLSAIVRKHLRNDPELVALLAK